MVAPSAVCPFARDRLGFSSTKFHHNLLLPAVIAVNRRFFTSQTGSIWLGTHGEEFYARANTRDEFRNEVSFRFFSTISAERGVKPKDKSSKELPNFGIQLTIRTYSIQWNRIIIARRFPQSRLAFSNFNDDGE